MTRKEQKGITLIALVITIIVLLILAGISIALLTGEDGIIAQASKAKIETRGASVQEVRDLWFTEKKLNVAKSLDEILKELREQNLLTDEEVTKVKETGQVTIGSRTIVFGKEQNIELVAKVIYDNYYKKYAIVVGFEEYQVNSDGDIDATVKKYLKNCKETEKEDIFVKIVNLGENTNFSKASEIFKELYEKGETSKLCTTLDELALELGLGTTDEMLTYWGTMVGYWQKKIVISGELTDPNGNKVKLSTENINMGQYGTDLFQSYAYEYEISQNGSYTFNFVGNDGQISSITVTIDENQPCIVFDDNMEAITLMAGIGNFVSPEMARAENAIYREAQGEENFDLTQRIEENEFDGFGKGIKVLSLTIGKYCDATVILTYKGQEYSTKADFWIPM